MLIGMTQPNPLSTTDRVAAALHVYADAIRLGQVPVPNFITLHSAALPYRQFMTLADHLGAPIEIVDVGHEVALYARVDIPFGAGILPDSVTATVRATTSELTEKRRADIATHNLECPIDLVPTGKDA